MTSPSMRWQRPPASAAVAGGQVHIWRARLDAADSEIVRMAQLLAAAERARAERFRFVQDRRRFVAAHGALRAILGRYLGLAPEQVELEQEPSGKPQLTAASNTAGLQFSLAHSDDLALCAVTQGAPVGIDIEMQRPLPELEMIAQRFFTAGEQAALRALGGQAQSDGFYTCWTVKEAYVKAVGLGLAFPLHEVETSPASGHLLAIGADVAEAKRWRVLSFRPAAGYIAALATRQPDISVRFFNAPPFSS